MMEESEAKIKFCPIIQSKSIMEYCKGTKCMLWKYEYESVNPLGTSKQKTGRGRCGLVND